MCKVSNINNSTPDQIFNFFFSEYLMNEFDIKAAGWDQNPMHWDRSVAIAEQIKKLIPITKQMTALEFGAGTGITSFLLKDYLKEITLMELTGNA